MFSVFSIAALHVTQNSFVYILEIIGVENGNGRKAGAVKPRFNDLRYNDIPGITINNLLPAQQKLQ